MLNSTLGGGIPGYMGESGVKATSPTDPHLSDPHAAANDAYQINIAYNGCTQTAKLMAALALRIRVACFIRRACHIRIA